MSIRDEVFEANQKHKSSWLKLGKLLTEILSNVNLLNDWGYDNFDVYIDQELKLPKAVAKRMMTAFKYVLENEPSLLNTIDSGESVYIPDFNSICKLDSAYHQDKIDGDMVGQLHEKLFDKGADEKSVMKELKDTVMSDNPMDDVRREMREVQKISRRLCSKLNSTSAFGSDVISLAEQLNEKIQAVEY